MRYATFIFLAASAPLLGQGTPPNAAARSFENRLKSLTLLVPDPPLSEKKPLIVASAAITPSPCAIPLLNAMPAGNFKMPVVKPPAGQATELSKAEDAKVGIPACNEKFFRK